MDEVRRFYAGSVQAEWERLTEPLQRIEFLSTLVLVERYFPAHGAVCDIGSGPGRYSEELLRRRYEVTLFDLNAAALDEAARRLEALGLRAEGFEAGDARDLGAFGDGAFDAVLVLGPLYHLERREERLRVLAEVRRVLRPGGTAIAAYLNSWGLVRTGLTDFPDRFASEDFVRAMDGPMQCGIWHWSTPPAAAEEIAAAGFEVVTYAGAEGFAGGMTSILARLREEHAEAYEVVARVAAESSLLPRYRDATEHLHFVCRRP